MTELIHIQAINSDTLVVDSREIAQNLGIDHHNFLQTVKKHQTVIEQDFGQLLFKTEVENKTKSPNPAKFILITESQFLFIAALSKNTPKAVKVKSQLVQAFMSAKQQLLESKQSQQSLQIEAEQNTPICQAVDPIAFAIANQGIQNLLKVQSLVDCRVAFNQGLQSIDAIDQKQQKIEDLEKEKQKAKQEMDALLASILFDDTSPMLVGSSSMESKALKEGIPALQPIPSTGLVKYLTKLTDIAESYARNNGEKEVTIARDFIRREVAKSRYKKEWSDIEAVMKSKGYIRATLDETPVWVRNIR